VQADRATCSNKALIASSGRSKRAALDDARVSGPASTIRVLASAHLVDSRGLASRPETDLLAVHPGGPPSTYESPSQEARQSAPRIGATGNGSGGRYCAMVFVHDELTSGSKFRVFLHRQVTSPVCRATSGLRANWAKRCPCT
jgi:hypothetical protein